MANKGNITSFQPGKTRDFVSTLGQRRKRTNLSRPIFPTPNSQKLTQTKKQPFIGWPFLEGRKEPTGSQNKMFPRWLYQGNSLANWFRERKPRGNFSTILSISGNILWRPKILWGKVSRRF